MSELTSNEKAATFIGWKPSDCPHCTWHTDDTHPSNAPDMSDPRNYMKARVTWDIDTYHNTWSAFSLDTDWAGHKSDPVSALAALYDAELAAAKNPTPHKESQ